MRSIVVALRPQALAPNGGQSVIRRERPSCPPRWRPSYPPCWRPSRRRGSLHPYPRIRPRTSRARSRRLHLVHCRRLHPLPTPVRSLSTNPVRHRGPAARSLATPPVWSRRANQRLHRRSSGSHHRRSTGCLSSPGLPAPPLQKTRRREVMLHDLGSWPMLFSKAQAAGPNRTICPGIRCPIGPDYDNAIHVTAMRDAIPQRSPHTCTGAFAGAMIRTVEPLVGSCRGAEHAEGESRSFSR
jgi:hypothetical protein